MKCEEAREGLGLLVLDALEQGEAALLNMHLADCGDCAFERGRLARVVDLLPYGLPDVAPPAALERRLLSRIEGLRRQTQPRRFSGGWPAWAPAAAAAALLMSVGVPVTGMLLERQGALQASLEAANRRDSLDRAALASLAAGSGGALALHSTSIGGGAHGVFTTDPTSGQVVMVAYGLPAAPSGRVYQGWMHRGPERISIGVFAPLSIDAPVVVTLAGQPASLLRQVDGFGITLEPLGGSPRPTTPPVMTS